MCRISKFAPLSVLSFNARNVTNKWPVITNEIRMYSPDIVLISESWIPASNDYSHFNFDDYVSFADSRIDRRGGGTLILTRASLRPTQLKLHGNYHHRCSIVAINIGVAERKQSSAALTDPLIPLYLSLIHSLSN